MARPRNIDPLAHVIDTRSTEALLFTTGVPLRESSVEEILNESEWLGACAKAMADGASDEDIKKLTLRFWRD